MFSIRFDMRAPSFGAPTTDLYTAAIGMSGWAERHGCVAAVLCEHHGSEDGYLPAPTILASAIAARTERLMLNVVVILPFYDPVRLAEDIAVLDIISGGRTSYVFGLGYRPEEFEHFGLERSHRGALADENLTLLRTLLTGLPTVHGDRRITVSPPPSAPGGPMLMWGGASVAAARRAGRYGLGLLGNGSVTGMREAYEAASREHGHEPGGVLLPPPDTPTVTFVADVDDAWRSSANTCCTTPGCMRSGIPATASPRGFRRPAMWPNCAAVHLASDHRHRRGHRIICGGGLLNLSPLCGGIRPEIAWPYLRRAGEVVTNLTTTRGSNT